MRTDATVSTSHAVHEQTEDDSKLRLAPRRGKSRQAELSGLQNGASKGRRRTRGGANEARVRAHMWRGLRCMWKGGEGVGRGRAWRGLRCMRGAARGGGEGCASCEGGEGNGEGVGRECTRERSTRTCRRKPDAGGSTRAATATRARSTAAATACSFASCAALIMRAARHRPAAQEKGSTKARERRDERCKHATNCVQARCERAGPRKLFTSANVSFGDKFCVLFVHGVHHIFHARTFRQKKHGLLANMKRLYQRSF
jgi:hypothetical protein